MNWDWTNFADKHPEASRQLWVRYKDGTENRARVRSNWSGSALLVQGDCGQYWRSMVGPMPIEWRYDEIPDGCLGTD